MTVCTWGAACRRLRGQGQNMPRVVDIEVTKSCIKCGQTLPLGEFHKHPKMADGHLNKCKKCVSEYMKAQRLLPAKQQSVREYESANAERIYLRKKEWREKNREYLAALAVARRLEDPSRRAAHIAVGNAVRLGKLHKGPCIVCGEKQVEAHHCDYSQLLDVVWLCLSHHRQLHAEHALWSAK